METKNAKSTAKKTAWQIQKNTHIFLREMMRYYDIYLLIGVVVSKMAILYICSEYMGIHHVVIGLLACFEIFFLFFRIGLEFQRKKNLPHLYEESAGTLRIYRTAFIISIFIFAMFEKWSFAQFGMSFTIAIAYYVSNSLMRAAAVTIHTKDVAFSEKFGKKGTTIVLNEKKGITPIIQEAAPKVLPKKIEEEAENAAENAKVKKRIENIVFRYKKSVEVGETKTASDYLEKLEKLHSELSEKDHSLAPYCADKLDELLYI